MTLPRASAILLAALAAAVLAFVSQDLGWLTLVLTLGYLVCLMPLLPSLLRS